MTHTIAGVRFVRGTNDGPASCECGWLGRASDFADHRRGVGARGGVLRAAAQALPATHWTRCPPKGRAGSRCRNCGRGLIAKRSRDGVQRIQHSAWPRLAAA